VRKKLIAAALLTAAMLYAQTSTDKVITLDEAVGEALANNLDLTAEKLNIPVAEAREITARLRPNPVLTISGQTLDVLHAHFSPNTPFGPNQLNIHTDVPIERGSKREERMELARQGRLLAELGVREVSRQVIFGVQSAFIDVLQAKNNLALAQENLTRLEDLVKINEARLRSGDAAQVEVDRSRLAAAQYRAAVQQGELQLAQAKTQLQLLMGRREPSAAFEIAGELRHDELPLAKAEIERRALTRRPDYLSDQQAQARSQADLRLQIATGKVDYSVGTEFTRQSAWGIAGNSMGVYFSMPLPIFNRNQGEIARAQREITLAEARKAAHEATIRTEVERAYRQYTVARTMLDAVQTDVLNRAKSVRDTTEYSYRRGEASLIEYLDAQRAFNDAMQTFNEARTNYARSLYLIDAVSGATGSDL
jgi:cobalt-zinc-cadmium efflux system outer membrane protein